MKSRKWWFLFPGEVYANDFTFEEPVSQDRARAYARWWWKVKRLPPGTEVWLG